MPAWLIRLTPVWLGRTVSSLVLVMFWIPVFGLYAAVELLKWLWWKLGGWNLWGGEPQ